MGESPGQPSLGAESELAGMNSVKLGTGHNRQGIQTTIICHPAQIQGNHMRSGSGGISACTPRGNHIANRKKDNKNCSSRAKPLRFLLDISWFQKRRQPTPDLRSTCSEQTHEKVHFQIIDTHTALLRSVRPGDWFISVDLKDAYFHISIYSPHRTFLRFAFQCVIYKFLVLPFSLLCHLLSLRSVPRQL